MMLWLALPALAGDGAVDLWVGGRTAPESALEQEDDWGFDEADIEPSPLAALLGRYDHRGDVGWFGGSASLWGVGEEGEMSLLGLSPRAGLGGDLGALRLDGAARYDLLWYPAQRDVSSGRAEALGSLRLPGDALTPSLELLVVDRHHPARTAWSVRWGAATLAVTATPGASELRLEGTAQVNDSVAGPGRQLRGAVRAQHSVGAWTGWVRYELLRADGGEVQAVTRPLFTPVGDYSADADALSAGGFLQHRGELGLATMLGPWTLRARALVRDRASEAADLGAAQRAGHGQLDLERALGRDLHAVGALGASAASFPLGRGYLDAYGWLGLSWRPTPRDD